MKIIYTKHAKGKFASLKEIGWNLRQAQVDRAILHPDKGPANGRYGTKIVLKKLDGGHDLRVIYVTTDGIITVITFYPTIGGRYEHK